MIFPQVSLQDWLQKHPDLKINKLNCDACGKEMIANKPFIEKGYAGLIAEKCSCGNNRHTCMSMVTTSKEAYDHWIKITKNYL